MKPPRELPRGYVLCPDGEARKMDADLRAAIGTINRQREYDAIPGQVKSEIANSLGITPEELHRIRKQPIPKPGQVQAAIGRSLGRNIRQPNKTEREAMLLLTGKFPDHSVQYEPLTFLCNSCRYTPDFLVLPLTGSFAPVFYEVKGSFKRQKDLLRLKAAAAQYRFRFILLEKLETGWQETIIRGLLDR